MVTGAQGAQDCLEGMTRHTLCERVCRLIYVDLRECFPPPLDLVFLKWCVPGNSPPVFWRLSISENTAKIILLNSDIIEQGLAG